MAPSPPHRRTVESGLSDKKASSDFKTRLISALVMAPAVIFLAWLGGLWFAGLMAAIALTMYWEWTVITVRAIDIRRDVSIGFFILALIALMIVDPSLLPIALSFALALSGVAIVSLTGETIGWNITGAGIASGLALCLIYFRVLPGSEFGLHLLVFLCFCVWAADIFAYLVGRTFGGPKLMPKISPKKTWSGFFGGLIGAMVTGGLIAFIAFPRDVIVYCVVALILALAAQAGDLIESSVKRRFNVKDASNLIPGHGGLLDRVDGLTLAAYAFVLIYAIGIL